MANRKHSVEVQQVLDTMKQEIATELGVEVGAEQTSRNNGRVGGQMTKKLIQLGQMKLVEEMERKSIEQYRPMKLPEMEPVFIENTTKTPENQQFLQ